MTTFDKREEAFEKKFALDEEQKFKAVARRNRLLGLWVAEKLGNAAATPPVPMPRRWSRPTIEQPATPTSSTRSLATSPPRAVPSPKPTLRAKLDELLAVAVAQVKAGT